MQFAARSAPSISAAARLRSTTLLASSRPSLPRLIVRPSIAVRCFRSESEYHNIADETLEAIQDALDDLFEDNPQPPHEIEVSYSSGVLTVALPPHGTWVLNKQTPNRQIWWSSPLSGPRRFEYAEGSGDWIFTRSGDVESTLGQTLKDEIKQLYELDLDLDEVR